MNPTSDSYGPRRRADRFLEELNPLSKLLAVTPVMAVLLVVTDPYTPVAFVVATATLTVALSGLSARQYLRLTAPIVAMAAGFALVYPLAVAGSVASGSPVLFAAGPLAVTRAGVEFGAVIAMRILSVTVLSLLFVTTTDTESFLRATIQNLGVPYRIGYAAMAAFRFVPTLRADLRTIRAAHRVRGRGETDGLTGKLRQARQFSIPLFVTAIRRAERTAMAMDVRAFGAHDDRTHYRESVFDRRDWAFAAGFWLLSVLVFGVAHRAGVLEFVFL